MALYAEDLTPASADAVDLKMQETSSAERAFQERYAGEAVPGARRMASLEASSAAEIPVQGSQGAAAVEGGTYQNRLMWMGTGFEERMVLIPPPQAEMAVAAAQPLPVVEEMSVVTPLESVTEPAPPAEMPCEDPAAASEMQSKENLKEMSTQAPPSSIFYDTFSTEKQQPAPCADATASTQIPVNGSKILQDTRGSDSKRWFVLDGVLGGATAPEPPSANGSTANVPVLEVFSLAGGVGKTSLVATLGRALSTRGERVLLVEATPFGFLPYFFGANDCRPGELRTFRPPASSSDAPIRLATVDSESLPTEGTEQDSLAAKIQGWAQGASRVIVDVATGSPAATQELSPMAPTVLVPLIPDVNSVITANSIDAFFRQRANGQGAEPQVYFVLNQFDPSVLLHLELAKALHASLGERLLPFALERDPAVSEALADGMTIIDYAPDSPSVDDYTRLAEWVAQAMAPVNANPRSSRWSER
ncbi:MAG TPA: cellulose synthase operon protein YhjQ/BcsQ [Terracidiphilus sp.]|nr:cellulose synthase operon protein YhjQ/BcsQ [Terracidiphilus sp.]